MNTIETPVLPAEQMESVTSVPPRENLLGKLRKIPFVAKHLPPDKLGRFLAVGIWNTFFAYASFALLNALLTRGISSTYVRSIVAIGLSSVINFTVAYLGYKWFVFKTKGNYLREWLRCVVVYSTSTALYLMAMPAVLWGVHHVVHSKNAAPYIAGAILTVANAFYCFMGHSKFSFRPAECDSQS